MGLKDRITADMKEAMRAKDSARLETIRMLLAAIQRREVDERITLDDAQVLAVVEKLVKQGRDSVDQFTKGGRTDLVDKETAQIAILETYLPEQLGEAEIDALIDKAIADTGAGSMKEMGKVMGVLKPALQGRADMGAVSAKLKQKLTG
jgi:uncharacterized protein YqeY